MPGTPADVLRLLEAPNGPGLPASPDSSPALLHTCRGSHLHPHGSHTRTGRDTVSLRPTTPRQRPVGSRIPLCGWELTPAVSGIWEGLSPVPSAEARDVGAQESPDRDSSTATPSAACWVFLLSSLHPFFLAALEMSTQKPHHSPFKIYNSTFFGILHCQFLKCIRTVKCIHNRRLVVLTNFLIKEAPSPIRGSTS